MIQQDFIRSLLLDVFTGTGEAWTGWGCGPSCVWGSCWISGSTESAALTVETAPAAGIQGSTGYDTYKIHKFPLYIERDFMSLDFTIGIQCIYFLFSWPTSATPASLSFGVLWAASGPRWCFWHSHHSNSGAMWPQQGLQTPGQLQLLSGLSVLHGQRPRLHQLSPGHGHNLQKGQWLRPWGHCVCIEGCWKVCDVALMIICRKTHTFTHTWLLFVLGNYWGHTSPNHCVPVVFKLPLANTLRTG